MVQVHTSVNISMLFNEVPFLERFDAAVEAGFRAVECRWPHGHDVADIEAALRNSGADLVLMNVCEGDFDGGERGMLCTAAPADFQPAALAGLDAAQRLSARTVNALAGLGDGVAATEQLANGAENLRWLAERAGGMGIGVVVESLNSIDTPGYLVPTVRAGLDLVRTAGHNNARVQLDVYHEELMTGDAVQSILVAGERLGHVQLADVPGRGAPGTGNLDFQRVRQALEQVEYAGFVGMEYLVGEGSSADSLVNAWTGA